MHVGDYIDGASTIHVSSQHGLNSFEWLGHVSECVTWYLPRSSSCGAASSVG